MPSRDKLAEFNARCQKHITGDEKGQAQILLGRLGQAFGPPGSLDVGGQPGFCAHKSSGDNVPMRLFTSPVVAPPRQEQRQMPEIPGLTLSAERVQSPRMNFDGNQISVSRGASKTKPSSILKGTTS